MTNYLVVNDGTDYGTLTGRLASVVQGEVGKVLIIDIQDQAGNDYPITGATGISASMTTPAGVTTAVTGTITVANGGLSWPLSSGDVGTDGEFSVIVQFTKDGAIVKTHPVRWIVIEDPEATAVQNPSITGVSELEATWLTAEKAAIEAADDGEILQSDGTNSEGTNYLTATSLRKHNFTAVVAPTVNDDTGDGYEAGSYWVDTVGGAIYFCQAATLGAAVWIDASAGAGSTDGGRMDWVIHVPGTLAANVNARWTIPVDCRILHISAVTSNNSDATVAFGISTDTDSILVPSTIGDSNMPVVFNSGDWAGTNPTADMTAGQIAVLTVDYDGASGTAGNDLTVIVTTTGNAVGDLADISDLAAAGFSANDYTKWNGSIFVNVTPAGVLSDIGAAAASDLTTHEGLTVTAHGGLLPQDTLILSKTEAYEVAAGDAGKTIECSGTFTVTFPNGLDTGYQVTIVNVGAGVITLSAATTLTSDGTQLATQYTGAVVYHAGSNVWRAMGRLT